MTGAFDFLPVLQKKHGPQGRRGRGAEGRLPQAVSGELQVCGSSLPGPLSCGEKRERRRRHARLPAPLFGAPRAQETDFTQQSFRDAEPPVSSSSCFGSRSELLRGLEEHATGAAKAAPRLVRRGGACPHGPSAWRAVS
jgi:hypothetical protein